MLKIKPHPFQQAGIDFAYKHYWTLIGDEQGLGKTLQALGLIDKVNAEKNLVVCPAMLVETWKQEILKALPDYEDRIEVISYDKFRKRDFEKLDVLVFDESHYLKNRQSKRADWAIKWTQVYPPRYLVMLSGTPIKNDITEFFSPIFILSNCPWEANGLKWKYGYHSFCRTYSNASWGERAGRRFLVYSGIKNLSGLKALLEHKYIRRLARNNLDLPPLVRKDVWFKKPKIDQDIYDAWNDFGKGGHYVSLKTQVALAKAQFTAEYALEVMAEGQVVIYSDHRDPVFAIEKTLLEAGKVAKSIVGGMDLRLRQAYIDDFKAGKADALVLTIGAASEGLTLVNCNHMIFNDMPWVPTSLQQAEKRIHRIGQVNTAFIHYILTGKLDKKIQTTILEKARLIKEGTNV